MAKRLEGKIAVVIGAGQRPGETIGNGRAMSVLFAREGAKVMLVDRIIEAAQDTQAQIEKEGGEAISFQADATKIEDCQKVVEKCLELYGRIDVFAYNIGTGDANNSLEMPAKNWDTVFNINLRGLYYMYRFVIPVMKKQGGGSLINTSSIAAISSTPMMAYRASKAGMNALTQSVAVNYAKYGIRANVIMPGLMNTPMAVDGISGAKGIDREELIRERNEKVPLKGGMGSAWDVAYAALFLASDEAKFISGVLLPVDGAQSARVG
ncbi:MAG: SDR family oxidoreductase [Deltaproteobacteria bacterium]|nr:SDR family oxidoreductase [Deltaproteobacteria bacterium]